MKAICDYHADLEQLLVRQQEGVGKPAKILKHFARGNIKLVFKYIK
jgi:hypothetical protein